MAEVVPYLLYEDVAAMLEWLTAAFGFVERERILDPADGRVSHAELALDDARIFLGDPEGGHRNPRNLGAATQSLYCYVDDVGAHFAQASAAGAEITEEPADQPYGDRRYKAIDPEGHEWFFAQRLPAD